MTPFERQFLAEVQKRIGAPYLWAAKGDTAVRDGVVVPVSSLGATWACDCSGLVTTTIKAIGGPDLRGWWNANAMLRHLPPPADNESLRLVLYGANGHADHVAVELYATGLVIEAAGGDSTTLTAADAARSPYLPGGARVGLWPETHHQRLGVRSLAALMSSPTIPPQ